MKISVLASGSKGNAYYIEGDNSALLLDAGISAREIIGTKGKGGKIRTCGGDPEKIAGILLTHEHIDHIRGAIPLGNALHVPVLGTEGTLYSLLQKQTSKKQPEISSCQYHDPFPIDDFVIEPFPVSHDARQPCGFTIREGDITLCCCSDTGQVTDQMLGLFSHADGLIIESNHCPDMLKNGPYPLALKRRIASNRGHLSNKATIEVLKEIGTNIQTIILSHLSEINNEPGIVANGSYEGLGLFADEIEIFVASSVDALKKPSYTKKKGDIPRQYPGECWSRMIEL